jgi:hypothetical protein
MDGIDRVRAFDRMDRIRAFQGFTFEISNPQSLILLILSTLVNDTREASARGSGKRARLLSLTEFAS